MHVSAARRSMYQMRIKVCAAANVPVEDVLADHAWHDPQVFGQLALMKLLFVQNDFANRQYDRMSAQLAPPAAHCSVVSGEWIRAVLL